MTKQMQKAAMGLAILATMPAAARPAAAADRNPTAAAPSAPSMSHVRSSNPAIGALIREAAERSTTFRGLVQSIDASDGIVYVESGACGHGVRACLVAVTAAGEYRMLRVKVDPRKKQQEMMASIGHELRHAVEVLGEGSVDSNAAMYMLYDRIGLRRGDSAFGTFETTAAIKAGDAVRAEVRRSMRAAQGR